MGQKNQVVRRHSTLGALLLLSSLFFFPACERHEVEAFDIDFEYEYFPLQVGKFWEYQVDSVLFDPAVGGTARDSSRTFFRDVIVDTLPDATGRMLYRTERYERTSDTLPWEISKVYTMSRDVGRAFVTEDNFTFIKMVFPPIRRKDWNALVFLDPQRPVTVAGEEVLMFAGAANWESRITDRNVEDILPNGMLFDSVLTVRLVDFQDDITLYREGWEKYVPGIGLIYRRLEVLDTDCGVCCPTDGCALVPWPEKAEKGFIVEMQLTDHN